MAFLRLSKELQEMRNDPPTFYSAGPLDDNDYFHWQGVIMGPIGSPYQGGVFLLDIEIPYEYPFEPPRVKFKTRIYHPNIDPLNGHIWIALLDDQWSPELTITSVLLTIFSLLSYPNIDVPLLPEIARIYEVDRQRFNEEALWWTMMYAM